MQVSMQTLDSALHRLVLEELRLEMDNGKIPWGFFHSKDFVQHNLELATLRLSAMLEEHGVVLPSGFSGNVVELENLKHLSPLDYLVKLNKRLKSLKRLNFLRRTLKIKRKLLISHRRVFKVQLNSRVYAMKELALNDQTIFRAVNERRILRKLSSQFCLRLYHSMVRGNVLQIYTDFGCGGSLQTLIHRLELDSLSANFYLDDVCSAVRYVHSIGIIHRDIKPGNFIIMENGHLKLIDFGYAVQIAESKDLESVICGTVEYLAPEVFSDCLYSVQSDWWAVGVLFFELLTGDPPFVGSSYEKVKSRILNEQVDFKRIERPEDSAKLRVLLQRTVGLRALPPTDPKGPTVTPFVPKKCSFNDLSYFDLLNAQVSEEVCSSTNASAEKFPNLSVILEFHYK